MPIPRGYILIPSTVLTHAASIDPHLNRYLNPPIHDTRSDLWTDDLADAQQGDIEETTTESLLVWGSYGFRRRGLIIAPTQADITSAVEFVERINRNRTSPVPYVCLNRDGGWQAGGNIRNLSNLHFSR